MKKLSAEFAELGIVLETPICCMRLLDMTQQCQNIKIVLTFRYCKEPKQRNGIAVRSTDIVMCISDTYIERVILRLTSCDRNGRLVAS